MQGQYFLSNLAVFEEIVIWCTLSTVSDMMLNAGPSDYMSHCWCFLSVRLPYGPTDPQRSLLDGLPISVSDLLQNSAVRFVALSLCFHCILPWWVNRCMYKKFSLLCIKGKVVSCRFSAEVVCSRSLGSAYLSTALRYLDPFCGPFGHTLHYSHRQHFGFGFSDYTFCFRGYRPVQDRQWWLDRCTDGQEL